MTYFDAATEFVCKCGRSDCDAPKQPHRLLLLYLDRVREMMGSPLIVTSGNRCRAHQIAQYPNDPEQGKKPSEHVWPDGCLGCDLRCSTSRDRARLEDAIRQSGMTRKGWYRGHAHVGIGDFVDAATFPGIVTWLG